MTSSSKVHATDEDVFRRDFERVLSQLKQNKHPKFMAVLTISYIETQIVELIKLRMPNLDENLSDNLFNPLKNGALSTAGSRAQVAFALGVIPQQAYQDYKTLFRIRNRFAHNVSCEDFSDPEICKFLGKLKFRPIAASNSAQENPNFQEELSNMWEQLDSNMKFEMAAIHYCMHLHNAISLIRKLLPTSTN